MTIARDVSQPDAFVSRAAVSASGAIVYPQSGGYAPRRLVLVGALGIGQPAAGRGEGVRQPAFLTRRAPPRARHHRPGRGERTSGCSTSRSTPGRVSRPAGSTTAQPGRPMAGVWSTPATTTSGGSPPTAAAVPRACSSPMANRFAGASRPTDAGLVFQEQASDRSGIRSMSFDSAPASRLVIPGTSASPRRRSRRTAQWLAYQSDETGQMEVYVRPYPGPGAQVPVSLQGGTEPVWAHSGRELYFRAGDSLMVATVTLESRFRGHRRGGCCSPARSRVVTATANTTWRRTISTSSC